MLVSTLVSLHLEYGRIILHLEPVPLLLDHQHQAKAKLALFSGELHYLLHLLYIPETCIILKPLPCVLLCYALLMGYVQMEVSALPCKCVHH